MDKLMGVLVAASLAVAVGCGPAGTDTDADVSARLAADEVVDAGEVEVTAEDGIVTLSGTVGSAAARDRALQIARETDGVRDVIDQLRVRDAAPTTGLGDDAASDREPDLDERDSRPSLPGDDREIVR